jgi:hypothetical protein
MLDELRNIERKLTIALRELEMLRNKEAKTVRNGKGIDGGSWTEKITTIK